MIQLRKLIPLLLVAYLVACGGSQPPPSSEAPTAPQPSTPCCADSEFTTGLDYLYKNGERFEVKGVVYVPTLPGYLPWEMEAMAQLPDEMEIRIQQDIQQIAAVGANTVRLWGAPAYCYQVIAKHNHLHILQTIWFDGAVNDFQAPDYKAASKAYIKTVVDRIYSAFEDDNPPVVAFLVGNELSEAGILSTNQRHPDITSFVGNHIIADNINASEAFIAEMADYLREYELQTYGNKTLISYANEIRTIDLIDTPFLDFRSQNAYSYAVPYYRPKTLKGATTGTYFQGWVEELKLMHPNMPLLITETGLSVSPEAQHVGPPNYGYGGNTEDEQAQGIMQNLTDIQQASVAIAGVNIHEFNDAWWKFGLNDSYSQDPYDIEEWFGMTRTVRKGGAYVNEPRPVYFDVQNHWAVGL